MYTREQLFAGYSDAMTATFNRLDIDAVSPQLQGIVQEVVESSMRFIPAQLDDNVIHINDEYSEVDGIIILPLLPGDPRTLTLDRSALQPSPRRLVDMSQETGLTSKEDKDVLLAAFGKYASKGITTISPPQTHAATTFAKRSTVPAGDSGTTLTYHMRPLVVVNSEVADAPSEVQGSLLAHEAMHVEDHERMQALGDIEELDPTNKAIAATIIELRGYHLGAIAAGDTQHPNLVVQSEVEQLRVTHAHPEDPFMPTRAIMQYLITQGIVEL